MERLADATLRETVDGLAQWKYDEERKALYRRIERRDFVEAFGLMTQIAILAEKRDHHPEWSNVYNRIDIWLTTHDAGGVSLRDVELAGEIDRMAGLYIQVSARAAESLSA